MPQLNREMAADKVSELSCDIYPVNEFHHSAPRLSNMSGSQRLPLVNSFVIALGGMSEGAPGRRSEKAEGVKNTVSKVSDVHTES